ncbi:MAG: DNA helicase, partial [Desulfobacterales bacterium]
ANLFDTDLSYSAIYSALRSGDPLQFLGTIEFFPEEGKYHFDGHRKCGTRFSPQETIYHRGLCPVCAKPLTLGVLSRVEALADRPGGQRPERTHPFYCMAPLSDILGELFSVGPSAKRVQQAREKLLQRCGCELDILRHHPIEILQSAGGSLLAEAVRRVRKNEVQISPGFDGKYGQIKIFTPKEKETLMRKKRYSMPAALET